MTDDTLSPSPKTQMRAAARRTRREAALRLGDAAGTALAGLAASLRLPPGGVVAGYWPLEGEIDPRPLMAALAGLGHRLALPAVAGRGSVLEFRRWSPGEDLEPGPHGTRHPPARAGAVAPSALLVPLLAFDRRGFRLGYGGGYYDRTLAGLRRGGTILAAGLAFAAQEVERVPADPWDMPLDLVATEQGVIVMADA